MKRNSDTHASKRAAHLCRKLIQISTVTQVVPDKRKVQPRLSTKQLLNLN